MAPRDRPGPRRAPPFWWREEPGGVLCLLPTLVDEWLEIGRDVPEAPYSWALRLGARGDLVVDRGFVEWVWGPRWQSWPLVRSQALTVAGAWVERDPDLSPGDVLPSMDSYGGSV